MIVNLIKEFQIYSVTLPDKVKGQFWLEDADEKGKSRKIISIEAENNQWTISSSGKAKLLDNKGSEVDSAQLRPLELFFVSIANEEKQSIIFAEPMDESRKAYKRYVVRCDDAYTIGRNLDNNIVFDNKYISGRHAVLKYSNGKWKIEDCNSSNGTYVNGCRVTDKILNAGDLVYMMGLKIIVGAGYFAINNPDDLLKISSSTLIDYISQEIDTKKKETELPETDFYYVSPRFKREIETAEIKLDQPPSQTEVEKMPLALVIGPSLTMGMASLATAGFTIHNIVSNGRDMISAMPTLMMSVSMLLGTVMWPLLIKHYDKKQRIAKEQKRQSKYLAYLDETRDKIKRICKIQTDIINENVVSVADCVKRVEERSSNLWERTINHKDFLNIRIGIGTIPMYIKMDYQPKRFTLEDDNLWDAMLSLANEPKELKNVPIGVSLVEKRFVGLVGDKSKRENLLKTMLIQMFALHSYDELKVVFIGNNDEEWDFVKFVPHIWDDERKNRYYANCSNDLKELSLLLEKNILVRQDKETTESVTDEPYYAIVATNKELVDKCEPLQKLIKYKNNRGFSVLLVYDELKNLPKEITTVISVTSNDYKIFDKKDTTGSYIKFMPEMIEDSLADNVARKVADIKLDIGNAKYGFPKQLPFLEMFDAGKVEHLNVLTRWKENNPVVTLQTPVGVDNAGGEFKLDLHEKFHGPHGLVAGMTGSGKSEFIITYILSMAVNYHPDEVAFVLIDYKGGGLAGAFEDTKNGIKLPHLAGTITNLDGASVRRSLTSIQSELRRRQAIFNDVREVSNEGTIDIYKYQRLYREGIVSVPLPHLFIISDEFAELKKQQPEFMDELISAARIGRSLGVHLILATQKPSGVVDDQIWSNSKFRVCLKVQEKADSMDMIKCPDAAELSDTGRFYLQVGFNELFAQGQSAWCGAEYVPANTCEKHEEYGISVINNLGNVLLTKRLDTEKKTGTARYKQIVAIVRYLSEIACEENVGTRPLWLPPIPAKIYVSELADKYGYNALNYNINPIIGEYDDPYNQKQGLLTLPLSKEGNCVIYGSAGSGKTTFLTTLCYSLITSYDANALNMYIMDFGSETLKMFERAPQVGDVILSNDEEKINNLFKMLSKEIVTRKREFAAYGGDYDNYNKKSGKTKPAIVVVINNYMAFAELFDYLSGELMLLTRDGVKYGIYFVMSCSSTNAIRFNLLQNFKQLLTLELNDETGYSGIVGKTEGVLPAKYKGRGLVALDKVYEFQTAHAIESDDEYESIKKMCTDIAACADSFAVKVPVLPEVVDLEFVRSVANSIERLPIGVNKHTLEINTINLRNKLMYVIMTQQLSNVCSFICEMTNVLNSMDVETVVVDIEENVTGASGRYISKDALEYIEEILTAYENHDDNEKAGEQVIIFCGFAKVLEQMDMQLKKEFNKMLEKVDLSQKTHYIFADTVPRIKTYSSEMWYRSNIGSSDGIWVGDGITQQYTLQTGKSDYSLNEEIGNMYGHIVTNGKCQLVKLLGSVGEGKE